MGGTGADTIVNYADNVSIESDSGNNYISNSHTHQITINTGKGDDTISSNGENVRINTGEGNDSIFVSSSEKLTVNSGNCDDTIILGCAGKDSNGATAYYNLVENSTVNAGSGNNVITNNGGKNITFIVNESTNSTINGFNETSTLIFGNGTETYSKTKIGNGDLKITSNDKEITITSGTNLTALNIVGEEVELQPEWTLIGNVARYGTKKDTYITVSGVKSLKGVYLENANIVKLSQSALGNSKVTISDGYTLKLANDVTKPSNINANWSINGTTATYKSSATSAGYSLSSDRKTINYIAASGGKTFTISGLKKGLSVKNGTIEGISIKDNVVMVSSNIIGDDEVKIIGEGYTLEIVKIVPIPDGISIKNNVLTASNKFTGDTINLNEEWATSITKVNVSAISHDLNILSNDLNTSIKAGKGSDTIFTGLGNNTLTGGTGNDVFVYSEGNDVITDYKSGEDQINLNLADVTKSSVKGSDVILTTDKGTLTLKGAKDKVVTFVDDSVATSDLIFFADTYYAPLETGLTYDSKRTVLTASSKFTGEEIDLEEYLETVTKINASALSQDVNIVGNKNNNSIKGSKGSDTINGGMGNDTLSGGTGDDSIFGGNDNDKILGDAGNDTLFGGSGNDTLTGGAGKDIFIYESGNDLITDYKVGEDQIKLNLADVTNSSIKGSDVILTTDKGTLTLKGAKDKVVTFVDDNGATSDLIFFADTYYAPLETGLTYDAKRTVLTASNKFTSEEIDLEEYLETVTKVNASALSQGVNIVGNKNNNSIKGGKGSDTINGGNGNDTLTGGADRDVFVYEDDNDVITDYKSGEDQINLNLADVTKTSVKGSDVILTTDEGTLTVKSTKDKVITFVDDNSATSDLIFFADTYYTPLETGLTYDAKRTVLTASSKFTGEEIDLEEYLETVTKVNASALSQDVNIVGNKNNNSIKGGKGSDTINGGNGNDTLTGGADRDVFVYEDGNDVITDYKAGEDSIKINGKISSTSYKGKDVIFSVGDGTLTVKGVKGKEITVTDSSGKLQTYHKTLDLLYDNNFVADEFGIADVLEVTENNYSVGKIEYSNNNNELANNSIVSSSFFDKK